MAWVADVAWMLACLLALVIAIMTLHGRPTLISVGLIVASVLGLIGVGVCVRAARTFARPQQPDDLP